MLLLSLSAVSLWAQEKYEYAIISLEKAMPGTTVPTMLCVFQSGMENKEKIEKEGAEQSLIKKVEEFNQNGWEVFQSNSGSIFEGRVYQYTYFLRKKKN